MHYALATLHTFLSGYPFRLELAVSGILAFGWVLGRSSAGYAGALNRPDAGWTLLAGLCGPIAVLFNLALIVDSMWFRDSAKLPIAAGWLLTTLLVGAICHRLALHTAHQALLADGYECGALPILPKQRGS